MIHDLILTVKISVSLVKKKNQLKRMKKTSMEENNDLL